MLNCSYAASTGAGRVSAHMQIFRGVVPKRFYELVTFYKCKVLQPAQTNIHVRLRLSGTSVCPRCRYNDKFLESLTHCAFISAHGRTPSQHLSNLVRTVFIDKGIPFFFRVFNGVDSFILRLPQPQQKLRIPCPLILHTGRPTQLIRCYKKRQAFACL